MNCASNAKEVGASVFAPPANLFDSAFAKAHKIGVDPAAFCGVIGALPIHSGLKIELLKRHIRRA